MSSSSRPLSRRISTIKHPFEPPSRVMSIDLSPSKRARAMARAVAEAEGGDLFDNGSTQCRITSPPMGFPRHARQRSSRRRRSSSSSTSSNMAGLMRSPPPSLSGTSCSEDSTSCSSGTSITSYSSSPPPTTRTPIRVPPPTRTNRPRLPFPVVRDSAPPRRSSAPAPELVQPPAATRLVSSSSLSFQNNHRVLNNSTSTSRRDEQELPGAYAMYPSGHAAATQQQPQQHQPQQHQPQQHQPQQGRHYDDALHEPDAMAHVTCTTCYESLASFPEYLFEEDAVERAREQQQQELQQLQQQRQQQLLQQQQELDRYSGELPPEAHQPHSSSSSSSSSSHHPHHGHLSEETLSFGQFAADAIQSEYDVPYVLLDASTIPNADLVYSLMQGDQDPLSGENEYLGQCIQLVRIPVSIYELRQLTEASRRDPPPQPHSPRHPHTPTTTSVLPYLCGTTEWDQIWQFVPPTDDDNTHGNGNDNDATMVEVALPLPLLYRTEESPIIRRIAQRLRAQGIFPRPDDWVPGILLVLQHLCRIHELRMY